MWYYIADRQFAKSVSKTWYNKTEWQFSQPRWILRAMWWFLEPVWKMWYHKAQWWFPEPV